MIITAKINDKDTIKLCSWNNYLFEQNLTLTVQGDDLSHVKELFTTINKLEILIDDISVGVYTAYNTFREISYINDTYVEGEKCFSPAFKVALQKTDLAEQVKRLDEKVNPVIDIEGMSVPEYKEYLLNKINLTCQNDIYAGQEIEVTGGKKLFTFKLEDQNNLKVLFDIVATHPEVQYMPYHASTESCEMFSRKDIITVYLTLLIRLTKITTYCNQLNMYVKSIEDKNTLKGINYGDELTGQYLENYNTIISQSMESMQSLFDKYLGSSEKGEENIDDTENENNENAGVE